MTLDLVTGLPIMPRGHNAVVVFVDRYSKLVHYVPTTKTVTASQLAEVFIDRVYKHHGLPSVIISDRDPRFNGKFWRQLFGALKTELRMSTANHPETDGQTERANRTLEEILRGLVDPCETDWDIHLPAAEFAANSAISAATGASPFQTLYGFTPPAPAQLVSHYPAVLGATTAPARAAEFQATQTRMRETMAKYNQRMAAQANRSRQDHEFKVGDRVLLSSAHLRIATPNSRKLAAPFVGPFTILDMRNKGAARLDLPADMRVNPVVNVSHLKAYNYNSHGRPPPLYIDGDEETYEVESILARKPAGQEHQYLFKWRGYPEDEATWEPLRNLAHLPMLHEFLAQQHEDVPAS